MLKVSRLADYAVVVLVKLGRRGEVTNSSSLAVETGVPEPTVAKVLKALSGAGLVSSQRGARGGYRIARPLREIRITHVIAAIDGPIAITACVDGESGSCQSEGLCPVRGRWDMVNDAVRSALDRITLEDMDVMSVPSFARVPAAELVSA